VAALWSDDPPHGAASALNALLSKLRRVLGTDAFDGRSNVRLLLGDGVMVDVEVAGEAVHRAESRVALGGWKEAWGPSLVALLVAEREFLPGEEGPWIDEQRRFLGEVRLRALETYGTAGLELDSLDAARITGFKAFVHGALLGLALAAGTDGDPTVAATLHGTADR